MPESGDGFDTMEQLVAAVREEVQKTGIAATVSDDQTGGFAGRSMDSHPTRPDADDEESLNGDIDRELGIEDDEHIIDVVDEDELEPGQRLVTETGKGPRLPGVYEIADDQLAAAAGKFKAANNDWKEAGKERKNALDELKAIAHMKEDLFVPDPENTGAKICRVGGMVVRLRETTKEKVEVDDIGDE